VDELIGVGFEFAAAFICILTCSAEGAPSLFPGMFHPAEADVALGGVEGIADRILAVGGFGAIDGAAGEQRGQFGDGEAVKLSGEDVVEALLLGGD